MKYYEIENLLVEYRDILVYLEFFDGNCISATEKLYLMKEDIINRLISLLELSKDENENAVIKATEDYLMSFW